MSREKKEEIKEAVIIDKKKSKKKTKEMQEQNQNKMESIVEVENEKENKEQKETKPYFFPRLVAYIIDVLIVSTICTGVLFFLPENKNYKKYMEEYEKIQTEAIEKNTPFIEVMKLSSDVVYDLDYSNVFPMIVQVVLIILYFIVFQFYNKGQTLGKKLMKLRLVSVNQEPLNINQVSIHAILINSILINMLVLASLLLLGRNYYFYASLVIQVLDFTLIFVILMMILFRKDGRGLHDVLAKTKVIQEK